MNHVPLYVYILFFVILYIGLKRCQSRVIKVDRLALLPIIFAIFSIKSVITLFNIDITVFSYLIVGIMAGVFLGHIQVKNRIIHSDKINRLIKIPGDVSILVLVLSIFFIEFFIHFAIEAHWVMADSTLFKCLAVIISGVVVGISTGRNATYYFKYLNTNSQYSIIGSHANS